MTYNKPVLMVDKITGQALARYWSVGEAARKNPHIDKDNIYHQARRKELGYKRIIWRYEGDYNRHESFENRRVNVPLELYCNGVYRYVANIADAAKLIKCSRESVSTAAVHNGTVCGVKVRRLRFMGDVNPVEMRKVLR